MRITGYSVEETLSGKVTAMIHRRESDGWFSKRSKIILGDDYCSISEARSAVKRHAERVNPDAIVNRRYMDTKGYEDRNW